MTLTTRLSLFFLLALALVLVGFSTALYLLARTYLRHQTEERLEAALNTLVAAADIAPEGIEWEPAERRLGFGPAGLGGQVVWVVRDHQGRTIDQSGEEDGDYLFGERWVRQEGPKATTPAHPPEKDKDEGRRYPALSITAGVPLGPARAILWRLAAALVGLSAVTWLLALFAGRAFCRRALRPVTQMAQAAREMSAADLDRRLALPGTADELEELGQAFDGLLDRLQESFERQRRFTGDASHQLRTPLAAILGQVEVALRRERDGDEYRRVLATVQEKAEHLRRIVESLLFLARADAEALLPARERVELRSWLTTHLASLADQPRAADLTLDAGGLETAWVEAHPVLLGELLDVLLDNAAKYSPPGTPIVVRLRREGGFVELNVEDQGGGIADEDLPYLFTPFFRAASARARGMDGLGLGLSIARRLAHACGGTLDVTSRAGQGSCFRLRLVAGG